MGSFKIEFGLSEELECELIKYLKAERRFVAALTERPSPKFTVNVKDNGMAWENTITVKEGTKYVVSRRASVFVDGTQVGSETTSNGKAAYKLPTFTMVAGQTAKITGVDKDDDGEESEIGELTYLAGAFSPPDAPAFQPAVVEVADPV